jgi:hypothetical protein
MADTALAGVAEITRPVRHGCPPRSGASGAIRVVECAFFRGVTPGAYDPRGEVVPTDHLDPQTRSCPHADRSLPSQGARWPGPLPAALACSIAPSSWVWAAWEKGSWTGCGMAVTGPSTGGGDGRSAAQAQTPRRDDMKRGLRCREAQGVRGRLKPHRVSPRDRPLSIGAMDRQRRASASLRRRTANVFSDTPSTAARSARRACSETGTRRRN